MFNSRIARTFVCLVLVFVLVFNIYAIPTKAAAISGTAVMIGLGAAAVVSSVLIGLGVMPGQDRSTFDYLVSEIPNQPSIIPYIQDGMIPVLRYKNGLGFVRYGVLSNFISSIRDLLFREDILTDPNRIVSSSYFDQTYWGSNALIESTVDFSSYYFHWSAFNGSPYTYCVFLSQSPGDFYISCNGARWSRSFSDYYNGYYYIIERIGTTATWSHTYCGRLPYSFSPDATFMYKAFIDAFISGSFDLSVSTTLDLTLGNVPSLSTDLSSAYADWSAGSIAVPHPGIDIPGVDTPGTGEDTGAGEEGEEGEETDDPPLIYWPTGIIDPTTDTTDVLTQENIMAGTGTLDDKITGAITGPIVGGITGDITLEESPSIPGQGEGDADSVVPFPFSLAQLIEALRNLFFPSVDYLTEKLQTIKNKYGFVESFLATIDLLRNSIVLSDAEPPVIYIELDNAQSHYGFDYGGQVAILDMTWYAAYKPTVDRLLSAFLWFCFLWKIFKKLPGYIQGAPDDVDFVGSSLPAVVNRDSIFKSSSGSLRRLK